jgi:peptidyl-prolyl cis-trans isomerase B (cyclophilin B)
METNNQGTNHVVWIIIVIAVIAVGYFIWPKGGSDTTSATESYSTSTPATTASTTDTTSARATPAITNEPLKNNMHRITIETNKGTIVFETYDADAPATVKNFIDLANKGFYNGTIFHRVIPGFMIQGGDPTGTGTGGPGYTIGEELDPNTASAKAGYQRGVVAMAKTAAPHSTGSQFFIMHADTPLPHEYTIFGKVISGMDAVDKIATTKTGAENRPVEKMVMTKVTVADVK